MRSLVVLVVLLAGCGRIGFSDGATDAGGDAVRDGDGPPVPPDTIRIAASTYLNGPLVGPIIGAYVFVDDGTMQEALTDANGLAELIVTGPATVHVAYDTFGDGSYEIYTYDGLPGGTTVFIGLEADRWAGQTLFALPVSAYAGADGYSTVVPVECLGNGATSTPTAVFTLPARCQGRPIPMRVIATSGGNPIAMMIDPGVVSGTSTAVDGVWRTAVARELAVPSVTGYPLSGALAYHAFGQDLLSLNYSQGTVGGDIVTLDVLDESIDEVQVYYGGGTANYSMRTPVAPADGIRSTVPDDRRMRSLSNHSRTGTTTSWQYTADQGRPGSALLVSEFYGLHAHYHVLDPSNVSVTRPRLPAPLDTLFDEPNVGEPTIFLVQIADRGYADVAGRMGPLVIGQDIYYLEPDYVLNSRTF